MRMAIVYPRRVMPLGIRTAGQTHVEHAAALAPADFFARYYDTHTPVLLEGFTRTWPAFHKWCPGYFAARFGDVIVEVAESRSNGVRPPGGWQTMRLAELAARMERETDASVYLVAQGHALAHPGLAALASDVVLDERFFGLGVDFGTLGLWLGPRHAVTPLHWDKTATVLAQVHGEKRVQLVSPVHTDMLYTRSGGYSEVDPDRPDAAQAWPLFADAPVQTITLKAGNALFLPPRWWHHVRSLSASASVSIGRFAGNRDGT